jgi:phosphopantetheine adenylyltransferase
MATRNKQPASSVKDVQDFVVVQLEEARKRIQSFEKELVKRGRAQQKELEAVIRGIRTGKQVRSLEKQATAASTEMKKRLDTLQTSVLGALGVASRGEMRQIHRELSKLTKRVDALVTKKPSASS